jgi:hypothetical protein
VKLIEVQSRIFLNQTLSFLNRGKLEPIVTHVLKMVVSNIPSDLTLIWMSVSIILLIMALAHVCSYVHSFYVVIV